MAEAARRSSGRSPHVRIRLDHVVIKVSHWERSNAFYRSVLGAELIADDPAGPARYTSASNGTSVYCRDPDGSLLELISYS